MCGGIDTGYEGLSEYPTIMGLDMGLGDRSAYGVMIGAGHPLINAVTRLAKERGVTLIVTNDPYLEGSVIDHPVRAFAPELIHVPCQEPDVKTQAEFWSNKWNAKVKRR